MWDDEYGEYYADDLEVEEHNERMRYEPSLNNYERNK